MWALVDTGYASINSLITRGSLGEAVQGSREEFQPLTHPPASGPQSEALPVGNDYPCVAEGEMGCH